jgi:YHS domain-containing protein
VKTERSFMNATDSACKMVIEDKDADSTSRCRGTTYYFCWKSCTEKFDGNPAAFSAEKEFC